MEPYMKKKQTIASQKNKPKNIRNVLKRKGYSLAGWSRANGYNQTSVWLALVGRMNGRLGREIRSKVEAIKD